MPSPKSIPIRDPKYKPTNIIKQSKEQGRHVTIAGPMVRYSKLPFRELCRFYNLDIVYTPMILAREFVRNDIARYSDFTTNDKDKSVIVQCGVNSVSDFMKFIEMINPFVDGIGINCGCPIRDQIKEGIGAALMSKPKLVAEMISTAKAKYGDSVCIDTKIRIHNDINETIEFVKMVEQAGSDMITIHGRTKNTRSSTPVDLDAIKTLRKHINIPVIANGDCFTKKDFDRIVDYAKVDGVMSARGILANPALFTGLDKTPWSAVEMFMHLVTCYGLPFGLSQHHITQLLENVIPKSYIRQINELKNMIELIDYLDEHFILKRKGEDGFATAVEPQWRQ
ncbi:unnamed protein product [Candida verbasci]|uniref:tRNA-dihydrouridine synthase n=1 Tax=Candida verbasci TaxID=1227364 RepID=A0A9W4XIC6_9ASCO|nr:unnamed protein product [Candida verbasci]